ncbi:hypothetical protein F4776DRAFT_601617 [Hypoxylon sp. NC0597]|nr:hypothetical protein F4776DRAFT_601617 [Hypoxylon sp. NC0597]
MANVPQVKDLGEATSGIDSASEYTVDWRPSQSIPRLDGPQVKAGRKQLMAWKPPASGEAKSDEHQHPGHKNPPSPVQGKDLKETSIVPKVTPNLLGPHEVLIKRNINGIWDPSHDADITVHLKMPLQEDLSGSLEELCRLERLGDFASAREFFTENLQEYLDRPQIAIEYAEMLLEQGDYKALSELDDGVMSNVQGNLTDSGNIALLRMYWELIQVFAAHYKPGRPGAFFKKLDVVDEAIHELQKIDPNRTNITSTEIKMLALLYRMGGLVDGSVYERLRDTFSSGFYQSLYKNLLAQGRIWDIRDIAVALISADVNILDQWNGIRCFAKDWSSLASDASTTLALLDIFVSLATYELQKSVETAEALISESAPLALSVIENDPGSMKSRPFTRWMLAKTHLSDVKGPHYAYSYKDHFKPFPGVVFHSKRSQLPQYVPVKSENPGWNPRGAAPEFERPVKMAVITSRELGDYQTEVMALQRLIILSARPSKEFEELCKLQKVTQGDICGYSKTLTSKYLISNSDDLKQELKTEMSELFDVPDFSNCLSMLDSWILNMLRYTLEDEGPAALRALKESDDDYQNLPGEFQTKISARFPATHLRAGRLAFDLPIIEVNQSERQNKNHTKKGKAVKALKKNSKDKRSNLARFLGVRRHSNLGPLLASSQYPTAKITPEERIEMNRLAARRQSLIKELENLRRYGLEKQKDRKGVEVDRTIHHEVNPSSAQSCDNEDEWTDESSGVDYNLFSGQQQPLIFALRHPQSISPKISPKPAPSKGRPSVTISSQPHNEVLSSHPGKSSSQEPHPTVRFTSNVQDEPERVKRNDSSKKTTDTGSQTEYPQHAEPEQKREGKQKEQNNPFRRRLATDRIEGLSTEESRIPGFSTWPGERFGRGLKPDTLTEETESDHLTTDIKDDGNAGTGSEYTKQHDTSTIEVKNRDLASPENNPEASESRISEVNKGTSVEDDASGSKEGDTGLTDKEAESERPRTESTAAEETNPPSRVTTVESVRDSG